MVTLTKRKKYTNSRKNISKKTMKRKNNKTKKNKTKKNKTKKNKWVYSKKDYQSGDGMLTSVWGPSLWHYLHTMSFNYPIKPTKEDKKYYKEFIFNLKHVLPCKYCIFLFPPPRLGSPFCRANRKNYVFIM